MANGNREAVDSEKGREERERQNRGGQLRSLVLRMHAMLA